MTVEPASSTSAPLVESISRITELGILPVVEIGDLAHAEPLYEALSGGGLPAAEITVRTAALEVINVLTHSHPEGFIGAGTVRTTADAARAVDAGAQSVVSPGTDPDVIAYCLERDVLAVPGACTPTEVGWDLRAGANLLNFFPAEASGGTAVLKGPGRPRPGRLLCAHWWYQQYEPG